MNELDSVRQLLEAPEPRPEVVAAGRARLTALIAPQPLHIGQATVRRMPVRRRWRLAAVTVGAAAAAAVTLIVAVPKTAAHAPNAALRTAILTAFRSASDDILYVKESAIGNGSVGATVQAWYSPWQPQAGRRVQLRTLASYGDGRPALGTYLDFTAPDPVPAVTWVDGLPVLPVSATATTVNYTTHTWSVRPVHAVDAPATPAAIEQGIAQDDWHIVGRTQTTIKLQWSLDRPARETITLWVDSRSYLPLREQLTASPATLPGGVSYQGVTQDSTFTFLASTAADQALLRSSVPAGYTQSTAPSHNG